MCPGNGAGQTLQHRQVEILCWRQKIIPATKGRGSKHEVTAFHPLINIMKDFAGSILYCKIRIRTGELYLDFPSR